MSAANDNANALSPAALAFAAREIVGAPGALRILLVAEVRQLVAAAFEAGQRATRPGDREDLSPLLEASIAQARARKGM